MNFNSCQCVKVSDFSLLVLRHAKKDHTLCFVAVGGEDNPGLTHAGAFSQKVGVMQFQDPF